MERQVQYAIFDLGFSHYQARALLDEERRSDRVYQEAMRAELDNKDRQNAVARAELEKLLQIEECESAAFKKENASLKCQLDVSNEEREALRQELQVEQRNHYQTKSQFDETYQKALLHLDMVDQRDASVKELEGSVGILRKRSAQ